MKLHDLAKVILIGGALIASGCGPNLQGLSGKTGGVEDDEKDADLVSIPVAVSEQRVTNFALSTPATEYAIDITGCATGYGETGATLASTAGVLDVYRFDQGCIAELKSITVGATVYNTIVTPFPAAHAAGDTAVFSDGATNQIAVIVVAQLSDPVVALDTVEYSFSEIIDGGAVAAANVSDAHTITVASQDAPNFNLVDVILTGIDVNGS